MSDTETILKEESEEMILEMVREQFNRTNPPSTEALYGRASRIDESIRELSLRQFNARYPLRVRREMTREDKGGEEVDADPDGLEKVTGSDKEELRSVAREVLLDFARAVAGAEDRGEMIDVLASVDEYVDRVLEAG